MLAVAQPTPSSQTTRSPCPRRALLVGQDDAGRAVGVGAAVVDAERRRHGVRGQRLLHGDLLAEQGVGVHGAVVMVLDRDLEQLLPAWCRTRACGGWRTSRSTPGRWSRRPTPTAPHRPVPSAPGSRRSPARSSSGSRSPPPPCAGRTGSPSTRCGWPRCRRRTPPRSARWVWG